MESLTKTAIYGLSVCIWGAFIAFPVWACGQAVGLLFAPTAHGGALFPGVMPLMVVILASMVPKEPFNIRKRIGFVLIVLGAMGIVWGKGSAIGTTQNIGHALFLLAGLAWAGYTVVMRRAGLDGLHAAAIADRLQARSISSAPSGCPMVSHPTASC